MDTVQHIGTPSFSCDVTSGKGREALLFIDNDYWFAKYQIPNFHYQNQVDLEAFWSKKFRLKQVYYFADKTFSILNGTKENVISVRDIYSTSPRNIKAFLMLDTMYTAVAEHPETKTIILVTSYAEFTVPLRRLKNQGYTIITCGVYNAFPQALRENVDYYKFFSVQTPEMIQEALLESIKKIEAMKTKHYVTFSLLAHSVAKEHKFFELDVQRELNYLIRAGQIRKKTMQLSNNKEVRILTTKDTE